MTEPDPFLPFRKNTIGYHHVFRSPCGVMELVYADWTASGRLYAPIENLIREKFAPFMANTHSKSSITGRVMTEAYHLAARRIKSHVGATEDDVLLPCGTGTTGAVHKLQRLVGLRVQEKLKPYIHIPESDRPIVFVTHMEHHSNHTSWLETVGDVVCLPPDENGLVEPRVLRMYLERYADRKVKIGAFTACSNVTGILTPYYALARTMHSYGGWCFVDFAASAAYRPIQMHPADSAERLDAVFLSPHKFLGGPGSCGLLVMNRHLYTNQVPDEPGGGTVEWTNPWGGKAYIEDIEIREDGGTPGILQLIRAALAFDVRRQLLALDVEGREQDQVSYMMKHLKRVPNVHVLDGHIEDRLPIFSLVFEHIHYNLAVRLLNDRFGIQARGGCSCAGTYGHYLFHIDQQASKHITDLIDHHDLSMKPGWVRISLHPMMTQQELQYILHAIHEISVHGEQWARDYSYDRSTNEFTHRKERPFSLRRWFEVGI